jgi:hypothetical protein
MVRVGEFPDKMISLEGSHALCEGQSSSLSVENKPYYSYQWKTDGFNRTGDSLYYLLVSDEGIYSADITNRQGGCMSASDEIGISKLETPPQAIIEAASDTSICQGDSVLLEVPFNADYSYQWRNNSGVILNATSNTLYAEKEGSYTVEVSHGSCATASQSRQVAYKSLLPKPRLYAYGPDYWFFVCDIRHAETYRWFYNGNLVAENGYNQYYAGTDYGEYYVEVYDGGVCYIPSDKVMIPLAQTGIVELYSENRLYLYPNPAQGSIRIFCSDSYQGKVRIRIISAGGSIAKESESVKNNEDFSEELNLAGLEPGLYAMELLTDQYTLRSTFIIIK